MGSSWCDVPLIGRRWWKHLWQRCTRGFDDSDTWSLDYTCGKWLAPRLKRFKEVNIAHPHNMTPEQWDAIIDKMIYAMEKLGQGHWTWDYGADIKKTQARVDEGLALLGKHFQALWW